MVADFREEIIKGKMSHQKIQNMLVKDVWLEIEEVVTGVEQQMSKEDIMYMLSNFCTVEECLDIEDIVKINKVKKLIEIVAKDLSSERHSWGDRLDKDMWI